MAKPNRQRGIDRARLALSVHIAKSLIRPDWAQTYNETKTLLETDARYFRKCRQVKEVALVYAILTQHGA